MPELCFTGGVVSVRSFPRDLDRRQKTAKDSFDIRPRTDTVQLRQVR